MRRDEVVVRVGFSPLTVFVECDITLRPTEVSTLLWLLFEVKPSLYHPLGCMG